ncbi:thioredoxin domain-containing protein [Flaviaesturariibacter aridisoli]|uniref:Thioredoxin n=1 Tax=Flaviaesturariibacter aridisoli TaxID=2545761 RepID=A0A4R4E9S4_9BACT|nr:thioredoxin domain-containing protein [Flaviaesturariibacter aridisoli]TCZ74851.1 hypothetical protein E0486_00670 [Flaviaesturariibacter aridisoli]
MPIPFAALLCCLLFAPALRAQRKTELPEAETWLAKPGAQIFDGRPAEAYAQSHLPGATLLPASDSALRRLLAPVPKNTPLLVYGKNDKEGETCAKRLRRAGYRQAQYLDGGIAYWRRNGLPLEGPGGVGMTRAAFDSLLHANGVVLVDFYADWCGYCPPVSASAERLAREHAGALTVIRIDADLHPDLCAWFNVTHFPTLYLYQYGKRVWKQVGFLVHEAIAFKVRRALREEMPELPEEKIMVADPY